MTQLLRTSKITVDHIKAHTGFKDEDSRMNDLADASAKGTHDTACGLPPLTGWMRDYVVWTRSRGYIPDNWTSAFRQDLVSIQIDNETQAVQRALRDPKEPTTGEPTNYFYTKAPSGITGKIQLMTRINQFPTRMRQHRNGTIDSPECDLCGAPQQDERHIFIDCPKYQHMREEAIRKSMRIRKPHKDEKENPIPPEAIQRYYQETIYGSDDWDAKPWLLRFNTAGGAEGETVRAVYVRFTPSTGATSVRTLPGLTDQDTYADSQALLVSADQEFALLDSRVSRADRKAGRLTLYPLDDDTTLSLDVRGWSKAADLETVGAAFDPAEPQLLRVVDSRKRVWKVDVADRGPRRDVHLPDPLAGDDDVRPVERRGGVIRVVDGTATEGEPALPCGFAGGFTLTDGAAWLFCADTPKITAYRLAPGADAWEKVGAESKAVVPRTAEDLPVVLPPVGTE
ncbi:MAG: zinc-binding domain-containing protein [Alphaproteobacteria bacterium]|nr:MAG: zinc-binding domain-containing protein [Alphaproteobacteria bacterium]